MSKSRRHELLKARSDQIAQEAERTLLEPGERKVASIFGICGRVFKRWQFPSGEDTCLLIVTDRRVILFRLSGKKGVAFTAPRNSTSFKYLHSRWWTFGSSYLTIRGPDQRRVKIEVSPAYRDRGEAVMRALAQ